MDWIHDRYRYLVDSISKNIAEAFGINSMPTFVSFYRGDGPLFFVDPRFLKIRQAVYYGLPAITLLIVSFLCWLAFFRKAKVRNLS